MDGSSFSDKSVKVLANFVSSWPGQKTGLYNLVTIANASGSAPPLVWIFNSAHEFPALAAALGADQPLIGLRSLNTVVRLEKLITWDERLLAQVYAKELLDAVKDRPFFVGGNCQGATIAGELARLLLLSGCDVQGFVAMEWTDLPPLPLTATLIFGEESTRHNPYLRGLDPDPMWQRIFQDHHVRFLPGGHGKYFCPDKIAALADHLQTALTAKTGPIPSESSAATVTNVPKSVPANDVLTLQLDTPAPLLPEDDVLFLWDSHVPCLPHREVAEILETGPKKMRVRVTAPPEPGKWTLQTFCCRAGQGPVAWAQETLTYHQVDVCGDQP